MKKLLMFLLSVMILSVTGCGSTKKVATGAKAGYEDTETVNDTEAVTTETPKEEITVEEQEAETTPTDEKVTEEPVTDKKEVAEESIEKETPKQDESSKPTESPKEEKPKQEPATTEKPKQESEKTPEPEPEPEVKGYSPDSVVAKAIAKCQAGGMITTQDNLANALAEGRITQEEYNEYYP